MTDPITPNAKLDLVPATSPNWAQKMNDNLVLLDAIVGSYFTINQLQGIWKNRTSYVVDDSVVDTVSGVVYKCLVPNISASEPTTFAEDRIANPSFWGGYTSPARARGPWMVNTSYTVNDFVVSGPQYAICIQNHVSGSVFAADVALGYWSILIDVSSVGSAVLPVPGGVGDANKITVTDYLGAGYTIISATDLLTLLGATSVGTAVFKAANQAAGRAAINAQVAGSYVTGGPYQPAGSYQPLATALTTLSGVTPGTEGLAILAITTLALLKSHIGLGTAAFLAVGTSANNIVQLDGTAKLPAVDGSALTNMMQIVTTQPGSTSSGSTITPFDNSIPESGEGDQVMSLAITPKNATNELHIEVVVCGASNGVSTVVAALFKDAETDARSAAPMYFPAGQAGMTWKFNYSMVAGTTSQITFKVRAGESTGAGFIFNGNSGGRFLGGVAGSSITITEIKP